MPEDITRFTIMRELFELNVMRRFERIPDVSEYLRELRLQSMDEAEMMRPAFLSSFFFYTLL